MYTATNDKIGDLNVRNNISPKQDPDPVIEFGIHLDLDDIKMPEYSSYSGSDPYYTP